MYALVITNIVFSSVLRQKYTIYKNFHTASENITSLHGPPQNGRKLNIKFNPQTTVIDLANDSSSMPLNTKYEPHFLIVLIVILPLTFVVRMSAVACVGCWFLRKK